MSRIKVLTKHSFEVLDGDQWLLYSGSWNDQAQAGRYALEYVTEHFKLTDEIATVRVISFQRVDFPHG